MKIYEIYHEFQWIDPDDNDAICSSTDRIGFVETEEKAKKYCETYNNKHVYEHVRDDLDLKCGRLFYTEVNDYLADEELSRPPYKNWYEDGVEPSTMWIFGKWDKEETK